MMQARVSNGPAAPDVPVVFELGKELEWLGSEQLVADLAEATTQRLQPLLQALQVSSRLRLSAEPGTSGRAVRVRVHGAVQPFPPHLLRMAWWSTMPSPLQEVANQDGPPGRTGYPDGWLTAYLAGRTESRTAPQFVGFLAELLRQIVVQRPSCLLRTAQPAVLLDLGVPLEIGPSSDASPLDSELIEHSFERLRANRIELRVNPRDLERLVRQPAAPDAEAWVYDESIPTEVQKRFETFELEQFALRGFPLPPSFLVSDAGVNTGLVAVRVNQLPGVPLPGIPPDLMPTGGPRQGARRSKDSRGLAVRWPVGWATTRLVGQRRRDQEAGSPAWVNEVVIPVLEWVVEIAPERLIGLSDIEYLIAKLEGGFPDLVRAVLAQFSLPAVTRMMRQLVRERVCIRDLRMILEALLEYEWVGFDAGDRLVFDERIILPEQIEPEIAGDLNFRIEGVLRALAAQLDQRFGPEGEELKVAEVASSLEARTEEAAIRRPPRSTPLPLTDDERDRLFEDAWKAAGGEEPLIVMTSAGARMTMRELLAGELLDVTVVARGGLRHDRPTRRVAVIGERDRGGEPGSPSLGAVATE